jgi:methionine-rich copper-binding protein CopC
MLAFALLAGCNDEPQVVSTAPVDGATDVPLSATISATFNGDITQGYENQGDVVVTVSGGGSIVDGAISTDGATATFTPTEPLAPETTYTVTLDPVHGQHNNNVAPYTWHFTTLTAPTVVAPTPSNEAVGVDTAASIVVVFSEPVVADASSVSPTSSARSRLPFTLSGTSPATMRRARPSTMAVFPTPARR